jgi:hypothetical protein
MSFIASEELALSVYDVAMPTTMMGCFLTACFIVYLVWGEQIGGGGVSFASIPFYRKR